MKKQWLLNLLVALVLVVPLALAGCNGSDGDDGTTGPQGPAGADGAAGQDGEDGADGADGQDGEDGLDAGQVFHLGSEDIEEIEIEVDEIVIASPPVIHFRVMDEFGRGGVGLGSYESRGRLGWIRFVIAVLIPGEDGDPDEWFDYAYERRPEGLVDHDDGSYTYTFEMDLGDYDAEVPFDPSRTHRLAIQSSSGSWDAINLVMDFVPQQLPGPDFTLPLTRDIVTTDACNECHGELRIHGSRYDTKYCVTCHNPTLGEGDMTYMVHAIHGASVRENAYELGGDDFSGVGYPQDALNCRKCHKGDDGGNWKTMPYMEACAACHDRVDFANGVNHITQTTNQLCNLCHDSTYIETKHLTDNATTHNPNVPEGAVNFKYEIASVTANGNREPVVKFRILADGSPVTFNTYSEGADLLTGFSRSPGFLMAWAESQDGITEPADWNNLGNSAGQPTRVDLDDIWSGADGTLTGPDGNGYYTATITDAPWPVGAKMRAVALQGYFNQEDPDVSRHTISVIKGVSGDTQRREIVDDNKCFQCHEWFEGHGGNRVYTTAVCATCHVTNLTSSGRAVDLSGYTYGDNSNTDATIDELGNDPLAWPEDTNSFKELIHGIHGSHVRANHYEFVRDRGNSGRYYYDFSHVTFPREASDCLACHKEDTYLPSAVPGNALWTTVKTTTGNANETQADVDGARDSLPNSTDLVSSPISSACYYCHDTDAAASHMELNGGAIGWERADIEDKQPVESCDVCHGEGRIADVIEAHSEDD